MKIKHWYDFFFKIDFKILKSHQGTRIFLFLVLCCYIIRIFLIITHFPFYKRNFFNWLRVVHVWGSRLLDFIVTRQCFTWWMTRKKWSSSNRWGRQVKVKVTILYFGLVLRKIFLKKSIYFVCWSFSKKNSKICQYLIHTCIHVTDISKRKTYWKM